MLSYENTLKLGGSKAKGITKKAILFVQRYKKQEILSAYNKLPQNIKDNLSLMFFANYDGKGYEYHNP